MPAGGGRLAVRLTGLLASALGLFAPDLARADTGGRIDDPVAAEARAHLDADRPREALGVLRGVADTPERAFLLTRAYLDAGNDFWAMRTLHDLGRSDPGCAPGLWLAFVLIRQGAIEDARDLLEASDCPPGSPLRVRRDLLLSLVASTAGNPDAARAALRSVDRASSAFPEDVAALNRLRVLADPRYVHPIAGRLAVQPGWTTNARAGSPVDPAARDGAPMSALALASASFRVHLPVDGPLRPLADAEIRGLGIAAEAGRDVSHLQLSARPAVALPLAMDAVVGYRVDLLGLAGGDRFEAGPHWFFAAHRAEAEVVLTPWLTAFGGAGRRVFRELRRTRLELDGGLGMSGRPVASVDLLGAITLRRHWAAREFYDLRGATALMHADGRLPRGLGLRVGVLVTVDDYPTSAFAFGTAADRRDVLVRASAGLWSPRSRHGLRAGITYDASRRFSTAPDYAFSDHRVRIQGQWAFRLDPRGPRPIQPEGHVPLVWGLDAAEGGLDETIQDLLRQDEAVRAGSSCVE